MRAAVRRHPVLSHVVLAYALSWAWWIPMALRGDVVRPGVGWPTHLPGLAGPAVAAVLVTALANGPAGLRDLGARLVRWRVGWHWWLLVLGTAALLGVVVAAVTGDPIPSVDEFSSYSGIGRIGLAGVVVVAFLANGVGEEAGWRGFAADRLLRDHACPARPSSSQRSGSAGTCRCSGSTRRSGRSARHRPWGGPWG